MGYPIGPEEAAKLLFECTGHVRLFVLLLMGALARPGAVRDLDKSQVDFEFGLVDLNPPGRRQNKKRRPVVRLPAFLRTELEDLPDGPLVAWRGAKVKSLKTAFKAARKRAKLREEVNTYLFRHGLAKWMRARGVPKWEVEGQLGHRKGTTDIYAHVAPDYLQNALDAIEAFYARVTLELERLRSAAPVSANTVAARQCR
jgi:integrase